jgi:hypothetical protein
LAIYLYLLEEYVSKTKNISPWAPFKVKLDYKSIQYYSLNPLLNIINFLSLSNEPTFSLFLIGMSLFNKLEISF